MPFLPSMPVTRTIKNANWVSLPHDQSPSENKTACVTCAPDRKPRSNNPRDIPDLQDAAQKKGEELEEQVSPPQQLRIMKAVKIERKATSSPEDPDSNGRKTPNT